ncbi:MAG: LytR C-terminal domain-containing protein [Actinomycetota bacterium]|nr:LytR C-terminal domain-containing protein [Actinomycetota bacterium]
MTLTCPPPAPPQLVAPAPPPAPPERVTVNVYNATDRQGLAAQVADDLEKRGFRIKKVGNAAAKADVPGPAEVRSGPKGDAAKVALAAHVDAETLVTDVRKDTTVDLVIGRSFQQLLTPQDAAAALAPAPVAAPRPAGC